MPTPIPTPSPAFWKKILLTTSAAILLMTIEPVAFHLLQTSVGYQASYLLGRIAH